jgi:2'-5' RNA ligase
MKSGIFVVAELTGEVRERVAEIQRWADPKLATASPPHITLVGSSGVGPIPGRTPIARIRELLEPIVSETPPIRVHFGPPMRFMQTDIIVLPIDPHGPLRTLHERIATSGLTFEQARFSFSPHCTLTFFPTLTPATRRRLLSVRVPDPVVIDRLQFYLTLDPQPARKVLELELRGVRTPPQQHRADD